MTDTFVNTFINAVCNESDATHNVTHNVNHNKYFSITKFVDFIHSIKKAVVTSELYFEGTQMFKNKFNQLCIKPVFMILYGFDVNGSFSHKAENYYKHEAIIDMFGCQPIITFQANGRRYMPTGKDKHNLYYLSITHEEKEYNGCVYFPADMNKCKNEANAINIKHQIINPKPIMVEQDIPTNVFT